MGTEFQFWKMKNVLEMEGDGCEAMGMYLVALSRMFKMVNFMSCVFPHSLKLCLTSLQCKPSCQG